MYIDKEYLDTLVSEYRSLYAMKSDLEAELSSIKSKIMQHLKDSGYAEKEEYVGTDYTVKWGTCSSSRIDTLKLKEALGDQISQFTVESKYDRLYIK